MPAPDSLILTVNAGSASLRLALFRADAASTPLAAQRHDAALRLRDFTGPRGGASR